jgi:two-component system, OmpR family, sensor histidine kinase VicK
MPWFSSSSGELVRQFNMGLFSKNKTNQNGGGQLSTSLRDEKMKSTILLNSIDDAIILIDADNKIQSFNPAAAALTGWAMEEANGIDYRSVVKLTDDKTKPYPDMQHPFYTVFQEKKTVRDSIASLIKKDGQSISVDISVSPLIDSEGYVSGAVGVIRNVDEQRKQEKQRADFISTASHEMRTPVAAIEGYLALALNEKVSKIDEKARSYLEKAHTSTEHLGKLFQDLLTSAKAEDGRLTSHPTAVNVTEFTVQLVEDLRFSAEKKGLALEMQSSSLPQGSQKHIAPVYYAKVDPDRLREVITNLFDNAVKYTEVGKITIGITGNTEVVQLSVADTGHGIPKTDIPHMFQKFYRVDNSATRTIGGTGLGLFICRKIVELYGGKIWVESEENKGSTFYINLPRLDSKQALQLQSAGPTIEPSMQNP